MNIVAITGGIASGKSTVLKMFADLGAATFSADEDARAIMRAGSPTLRAVLEAFPSVAVSEGNLDRAKLASLIFANLDERRRLEALTHPPIVERMRAVIARARAATDSRGILAYEVPLLFELGLETLFDTVITVIASRQAQEVRLQARERQSGRPELTPAALADRLDAQLSPAEKERRADYVVSTDCDLETTREQIAQILNLIGGAAHATHSSQA